MGTRHRGCSSVAPKERKSAPGCSRAPGDPTIDAHRCGVTGPGEANGVSHPTPTTVAATDRRRPARRAPHRVTHGEHSPLSAPPSCAASTTQHRAVVATPNFSAAGWSPITIRVRGTGTIKFDPYKPVGPSPLVCSDHDATRRSSGITEFFRQRVDVDLDPVGYRHH